MKATDEKINVCTITPDGTVRVYGHQNKGVRPYKEQKQFQNYGQARLWVSEYEDRQRIEQAQKQKQ